MRGLARILVLASLVAVSALAGCRAEGPPRIGGGTPPEPDPTPLVVETALSEATLCWEANVAIRQIIAELMGAPNSDAALVKQTVASYRRYAARLRELSGLALTAAGEQAILRAAEAAEAYAQEVHDRDSYTVDISGAVQASRNAFPGCDLEG